MDDQRKTPKRRGKISYRIPVGRETEFDMLVALSGLSMTDRIFGRSRHDPTAQKRLVQILDEAGQIKAAVRERDLSSDGIEAELKLIRTALMSLLGRRT